MSGLQPAARKPASATTKSDVAVIVFTNTKLEKHALSFFEASQTFDRFVPAGSFVGDRAGCPFFTRRQSKLRRCNNELNHEAADDARSRAGVIHVSCPSLDKICRINLDRGKNLLTANLD